MLQIILSIIFVYGIWNFSVIETLSNCYADINKPIFCQPNFINIVQNATAIATSTCGIQGNTEKLCNNLPSDHCFNCSNSLKDISRNTSLLFDRLIRGRETCWISGKISESEKKDVINVTINLDKLYEAYYVTIEFCGKLPDSIILYKSNNFGQNWSAWHYFSTSCQKTFGMPRTSTVKMERNHNLHVLSPVCFSLKKSIQTINSEYQVVPFNPMIGRKAIPLDSMNVKEWTSLTNLKISMIIDNTGRKNRERVSRIGISDVTIGGRAQCYGHAADLKDNKGSIICDCEHKTDGSKCDKCLNTHNDQPWKAIFSSDSSTRECQKCFCNDHAAECTFDVALYTKYNGLHGSRCLNCLHNTVGPNCDSCSSGFFRNFSFPINHTEACQQCKCHTIGSKVSTPCDPITGNCDCKEGVEGLTCNKCKKGFHQTRSSTMPCAPDIQKKMMATEERCGSCGKNRPRIKFKKFCRKHIMIKISIQSKEIHGVWTRFGVRVEKIWRVQPSFQSQVNLHESEYSIYPIWVENSNIRCNCPNFELGQMYLLLTKIKQKMYLNQPELIVDKKSTVLKWRDNWYRRLTKFKEREKEGKCNKFKYRRRYSREKLMNTYRHVT